MNKAVVLLSGGLDSTTTLAIAKSEGFEVYALSFNYGQRHDIELKLAAKNADYFKVKKHLTVEFNMRDIGGSALTADIEVPKGPGSLESGVKSEEKEPDAQSIPITYVPARNTVFLSFALAWAETLEAGDIFIGANAVDYSGYPDCRPEYLNAFEVMANLATKASLQGTITFHIHAPLIKMSKADIIKKGISLDVDYSKTWSCYDPVFMQEQGMNAPCLKCDSCRLRAKGFEEADMKDPLL